ncbi:MAG: hypothetical protein BWY26_00498 [Elusimicrobia bacterium ADurb.Bin231]|nr:MAG: hypothetical protein BWY26_00498 [Elusimicrobia bacterium ADurb.Bin231]
MTKLNKVNWDRFKELAHKLMEYKAKISNVPIRAESWEEVIYAVLLYMEHKVIWEPTSHGKGVDLDVKINGDSLKISAKGGKITNNYLSISSYRLTRYRALQEMLNFLYKNANELDVYLVCAREEEQNIIKYHVFKILPQTLVPEKMMVLNNWEENEQGWSLKVDVGFGASITKKMSNQLWYSIPLSFSYLEQLTSVEISKKDIGSALVDILKSLDKKK